MHAVCTARACHVNAVVDKQSRRRAAGELGRAHGEIVKRACRQLFFAELNKVNAGVDGLLN